GVAIVDLANAAPEVHLLEELQRALRSHGPDAGAVFVVNLDALLLDATGGVHASPAIEELNRSRDKLPAAIPARIVCWLSDAGGDALARTARDLYDIVATFFRFESKEVPRAITKHHELPGWIYLAPPAEEDRLRREAS